MRTSNKILTATLALLIIGLALYDLRLKAEYKKGDYADPYRDFVKLDHKDFDAIELNSSTAVNIMLVQGPFKVMVTPQATDFVDIRQEKNRLIVDVKFRDHFSGVNPEYVVYISCPVLSCFKADAHYLADGVKVTDTVARDLGWRPTVISGFNADSLVIQEDHASNVKLENNRINSFRATVGLSDKSGAALTIGKNNQFTKSNLDILNRSKLWIKGTDVNNLNYKLADSASLIINGVSAKHMLKLY